MKFTGFLVSLMMTSLASVTSSAAFDLTGLCENICDNPDQYAMIMPAVGRQCQCAKLLERTTPAPVHLTTDICDYLCSIQLGGQACECSRPSLPGRK